MEKLYTKRIFLTERSRDIFYFYQSNHSSGKMDQVPSRVNVIIIGAGVAGTSTALGLVKRGVKDVLVLDKGSLFHTGGSSSHAPGGILILHPTCPTLTECSKRTSAMFQEVGSMNTVDEIILARTPERMAYLQHELLQAKANGFVGVKLLSREECKAKFPLMNENVILGGLLWPKETGIGRVATVQAVERMANIATATGGVKFVGHCLVRRICKDFRSNQIQGVELENGQRIEAQTVICCAGAWTDGLLPDEVRLPIVNVEHQWVITEPVEEVQECVGSSGDQNRVVSGFYQSLPTSMCALFDADVSIYIHQYGSRIGVGNYNHEGLLVNSKDLARHTNTELPFTSSHFQTTKSNLEQLIPCLNPLKISKAFNGLMTFSVDGFPITGPCDECQGLWVAVGVWVMHSVGIGQAMADWIVDGSPPNWFDPSVLAPSRTFPTSRNSLNPEVQVAVKKSYETRCAIPPTVPSKL